MLTGRVPGHDPGLAPGLTTGVIALDTEIRYRMSRLRDEAERSRRAAAVVPHGVRRAIGRVLVAVSRSLEGLEPERPCLPEEA